MLRGSICFFFFNDTATTEIYTLPLHDALPISGRSRPAPATSGFHHRFPPAAPPSPWAQGRTRGRWSCRSEEHTSELQSRQYLVCRLLLEKKNNTKHVLLIYHSRHSILSLRALV